jgi:hypothetical protein
MGIGYRIEKLEEQGISLYAPSAEYQDIFADWKAEVDRANAPFLKDVDGLPSAITGTFVYAHPPNYVGRCTLDWPATRWEEMLEELKGWGFDTILFQAAGWLELEEMYYRGSKVLPRLKSWPVVESLLEANTRARMKLHLGGLGSAMLWHPELDEVVVDRASELYLNVCRELYDLGCFDGFYISPETAFPGQRQPQREKMLNRFYRAVCGGLKKLDAERPVIMSPGTRAISGCEEDAEEFLRAMFDRVPVDILAPQDSIGTMGNRLPDLRPSFELWQRIAKTLGARLWANVELFERAGCGITGHSVPVEFRRVAAQIRAVEPLVEKIICWEAPYYLSDASGERGTRLRRDYLEAAGKGNQDESGTA